MSRRLHGRAVARHIEESWIPSSGFIFVLSGATLGRANRVRVTVDDLRSAAETDIRRSSSDGAWIRWLDAAADLRGQSFRNVILIKLQMPEALWVDGRQGWQRRGRRVRRGASGIRIIAAATEVEHSADPVQGHGVTTLWDVSQTDGRPLGAPGSIRPQDAFGALERVAAAGGYGIERGHVPEHERAAATVHRGRRIVVSDDLDVPMATISLAHELAHLRMHKHTRDSRCHGVMRAEADAVAYLLIARLGCLPDRPSADLIARTSAVVGKRALVMATRLSPSATYQLAHLITRPPPSQN